MIYNSVANFETHPLCSQCLVFYYNYLCKAIVDFQLHMGQKVWIFVRVLLIEKGFASNLTKIWRALLIMNQLQHQSGRKVWKSMGAVVIHYLWGRMFFIPFEILGSFDGPDINITSSKKLSFQCDQGKASSELEKIGKNNLIFHSTSPLVSIALLIVLPYVLQIEGKDQRNMRS